MDSYDNEWILLLVLDDDLFWRDDDVEAMEPESGGARGR